MKGEKMDREIARVSDRLGPHPGEALRAFVDLGLDDLDIARYNSVSPAAVSALRKHYCIAAAHENAGGPDAGTGELDDDVYLAEIRPVEGDVRQLHRAESTRRTDGTTTGLRQFALTMRSKLFDRT